MRSTLFLPAALLLLAGCATFKELEPKPELSPREQGYIELKNDSENFRLDQGKHYFIKFPRPVRTNFVLVLQVSTKRSLRTYLTRAFDDGKEPIIRMPDETAGHDSLSVYAIDTSASVFTWVVEEVAQDVGLTMKYRYVPRWRYTFENKYAGYKETLAGNLVDRSTFQSAPGAPSIDAVDFPKELKNLTDRTRALSVVNDELKTVAGLFPPDIAASHDTAYINYTSLRSAVEEELRFQENYAEALGVFQKERVTWGNTGAFLAGAGSFAGFLGGRDRFPEPMLAKARKEYQARLIDAVPYYEKQLQKKRDAKPFVGTPPLEPVEKLYRSLGAGIPADFAALYAFVGRFNLEAAGLQVAGERLKELTVRIDKMTAMQDTSFFAGMAVAARDIRSNLPKAQAVTAERYRTSEAARILALELAKAGEQADDLQVLFTASEQVARDLAARRWASAERTTRDLYEGKDGKTLASVARQRDRIVSLSATGLFTAVKKATQDRLDAFVKLNETSITDVPKLYADSAFLPVYALTFSPAGQKDLTQKRNQIDEYITKVRNYQLPEAAIRSIYKDFSRDMNTQGVDRARAIVEHGKMYRGNDKELASIVNECDPAAAKLILRPKEYRRVLALPVTSNRQGVNEYMFRLRLDIPSEAQFPVFDVNIKLPKELADGAGRESWYDAITINKNPIKNEGRFRITAPVAENNYESQITPVQMDKNGVNILEVRFKKSSYKVYEISAMAQVPIMKKN